MSVDTYFAWHNIGFRGEVCECRRRISGKFFEADLPPIAARFTDTSLVEDKRCETGACKLLSQIARCPASFRSRAMQKYNARERSGSSRNKHSSRQRHITTSKRYFFTLASR